MDALTAFLENPRIKPHLHDHFLGLLHILIGRRVLDPQGNVISRGMTFRDTAAFLKKVRWDPDVVKQLGIDPDSLPLRDRQRYWFSAICQAKVDGAAAAASADHLAALLRGEGFDIGLNAGQERSA